MIKASAVIVVFNEATVLEECLKSVSFFEEIICIDLGSTDRSQYIANKYATCFLEHERVEVVEELYDFISNVVANEWVLFIDPDERISPSLKKNIQDVFAKPNELKKVGVISLPWQFFYKSHKLIGTFWGGDRYKYSIRDINKNHFSNVVHHGMKLIDEYDVLKITRNGDNYIHHQWMTNFTELLNKHKRYIIKEGESRYLKGERYKSAIHTIYRSILAFYRSYVTQKGYKDGFIGVQLSFFWLWYNFKSYRSLRKFEKTIASR